MSRSCLPPPSGQLLFVEHGLVIPWAGTAVLHGSPGQLLTCRCQCPPGALVLWWALAMVDMERDGMANRGQAILHPSAGTQDSFPPQRWWTWLWVIPREQQWVKMMVIPVLTFLLCPPGSMYDGLADNYNNYGTTSRTSYFSKFQAGNGSWGYPVRNRVHPERSGMSVGMVWGS